MAKVRAYRKRAEPKFPKVEPKVKNGSVIRIDDALHKVAITMALADKGQGLASESDVLDTTIDQVEKMQDALNKVYKWLYTNAGEPDSEAWRIAAKVYAPDLKGGDNAFRRLYQRLEICGAFHGPDNLAEIILNDQQIGNVMLHTIQDVLRKARLVALGQSVPEWDKEKK